MNRIHTLLSDIKANIKETDPISVKQKIENDEDFVLLDVREENEWVRGHIPKAIHLSKGFIECRIEQVVPNLDTPIILYCGGGIRSAIATESIQRLGYTNVVSMDGGFNGWVSQGFPVE